MANEALNRISCDLSDTLGTGMYGCVPEFKKSKKLVFSLAGFVYPDADTFTDASIQDLVAKGDIFVLENIASIEDDLKPNTYRDIGDQTDVLDLEGKYGFKVKFIRGPYNNKILNSISGNGRFDVAGVDAQGKMIGTTSNSGYLKGFTMGKHQAELMEGFLSTDTPTQVFSIQLLNTYEVANYAIIESTEQFNALAIPTLNNVSISFTSTPSDGDTTISLRVARQMDNKLLTVTGVDYEDFLVTVNGVTKTLTAGDDSVTGGTYVLTFTGALATGDKVTARLYDNVDNRAGVFLDGVGYKSNIATATVVI